MSSILVLGGAGYIGSHTVYELIAAGENVVVVDNLETGFRKAVHPDAKFYLGDIRDRTFIDSVFEKEEIDGVIHFAANSQVGESMVNPLKYYNNNLCGTEVLLESMVAHGINKIVFFRDRTARYNCCTGISSDCVSTLHGKIEFGRKE